MPVEVTCATCGKTKLVKPSAVRERNFCSPLHSAIYAGIVQKGQPKSAEHRAKLSAAKQNISAEYRAKLSVSTRNRMADPVERARISGQNSPFWKGGATNDRGQWEQNGGHDWKRRCRHRDRYTCRICCVVKSSRSKGLHVHHIAPFATYHDLRSHDDNGATVCNTCHAWLHSTDGEPWRAAWEAELLNTLTDPEEKRDHA